MVMLMVIILMMTPVYAIAANITAMSVFSGHQLLFQAKKESHQYISLDFIFFILFKNISRSRMYISSLTHAAFPVDMIVLKTNLTMKNFLELKLCNFIAILRRTSFPVHGILVKLCPDRYNMIH